MGTGEMTSAEIGSIRARVVLVVEFPRVVTISIRMFPATGPVLMIGDETLGITIRRQIKIGAVGTDGTSVVNRQGGGAGVLVTEILPGDEDHIVSGSWFFVMNADCTLNRHHERDQMKNVKLPSKWADRLLYLEVSKLNFSRLPLKLLGHMNQNNTAICRDIRMMNKKNKKKVFAKKDIFSEGPR